MLLALNILQLLDDLHVSDHRGRMYPMREAHIDRLSLAIHFFLFFLCSLQRAFTRPMAHAFPCLQRCEYMPPTVVQLSSSRGSSLTYADGLKGTPRSTPTSRASHQASVFQLLILS